MNTDNGHFNCQLIYFLFCGKTTENRVYFLGMNFTLHLISGFLFLLFSAPKVFAIAFSVVKNFLNEYTLQKIQIITSDPRKWQPVLLGTIDRDQLPAHFGGTLTDPDGNPRYTTKVRFIGCFANKQF
jgi:hypothetical protein